MRNIRPSRQNLLESGLHLREMGIIVVVFLLYCTKLYLKSGQLLLCCSQRIESICEFSKKCQTHTFVQRRLCIWKNKTESCSLWSDWHDWPLLSNVLQALWLVSIHPFKATVCHVELFSFGRSLFPVWLVGLSLSVVLSNCKKYFLQ